MNDLEKREALEKKRIEKQIKNPNNRTSAEIEIIKLQEEQEKNQEDLKRVEEMLKNTPNSQGVLNQSFTKTGNKTTYEDKQSTRENNEKDQSQEKRSESKLS